VEPQQLPNGQRLYLGLGFSMLDQKQAIPVLDPHRERQLEYDITRAISNVMTPDKPVVGVMSSLPVSGMSTPMMMEMGQQGRPPWVFYNELKRSFTVREVPITAEQIPDDVKVLVVIHPKDLRPATEYAIDQFVLKGGKLVAFLDPFCVLDQQPGRMAPPTTSTFPHLLKAWGITFDTQKVIADMTYCAQTRQGKQPAILALTADAFNKEDIITADMDNAELGFAGVFSGTSSAGLKVTTLMKSSKDSELVNPMQADSDPAEILSQFHGSGIEYPLALRVQGIFKTAFPEGKPVDTGAQPGRAPAPAQSLKASAQENTVILFGDADFIQDPVAVTEVQNPFGTAQRLVMPANGNLNLAESAVEQMAGNDALIALRSRGVTARPFTRVKTMEDKAEAAYRDKIQQLETSLRDTQTKLAQLQNSKPGGGQFILSPRQQEEIANFRKTEGGVRKQLKDVRRSLRANIDSMEDELKWFNIALMPAIVAAVGIGAGLVRHRRAAAR
jgi:ABC-type uncharacterized transport system involved in gliding motility auxiliary subunit